MLSFNEFKNSLISEGFFSMLYNIGRMERNIKAISGGPKSYIKRRIRRAVFKRAGSFSRKLTKF